MKKIIKNPLLTFILGAIIFGGIGIVSAYTLFAGDIGYTPKDATWEVDNVKDAIDELYEKKDIKSGLAFLYTAKGDGLTLSHNYNPYSAYLDIYHLDFTGIKSFIMSYSLTTTNTSYQRISFSNNDGLNYQFNISVSNQEIVVNEAVDVAFNWTVSNNNTGVFKVLSYTTVDDVVHTFE